MFGDRVITTALLDRLLHHCKVISIEGQRYRLKSLDFAKKCISAKQANPLRAAASQKATMKHLQQILSEGFDGAPEEDRHRRHISCVYLPANGWYAFQLPSLPHFSLTINTVQEQTNEFLFNTGLDPLLKNFIIPFRCRPCLRLRSRRQPCEGRPDILFAIALAWFVGYYIGNWT